VNRSKRKLLEENEPQPKSNNNQKKNELINLIDEDDIDDEVTEREVDNDDIELIDTDDEESDDVRNKKRKRAQPKNGKKVPRNYNKPSRKQIKNQKSTLQSDEDDDNDDYVSVVTGNVNVDHQLSVKQHPNDPFLLSLSSSAVNNNKKANNESTVFRDSQYSRLHCIAKFLHAKLDVSGYCDCEYDESILKSSLSSDYLLSTLEANSIANIENVMNAAAIPMQSILSNPDQQSISVIEAIYSSYQVFSDNDIWLSR
jgi:hypothetical protein